MTNPVRLRFSEDKTLLFALIRPQDVKSGRLEAEELLEALLEMGYSSFQFELDQHAFDDLTQLRWDQLNREIVKCLARRVEFELQVQISEDQMQAWASVQPAFSGEEIPLERLLEKLAYAGVKQGYLYDALKEIMDTSQAEQLLVARGSLPEHGANAWLEPLFQRGTTEIPSALVGQLEQGVPLAQLHPATPGQSGMTVTGQILPAKSGKNLQLVPSAGSDFSPVDPQILVSTQTGCPVLRFNSVRLDPILTVEKVDEESGDLNYSGSILILGAVQSGYLVQAKGHIEVLGDVGGARLEAGGDILIHGAVNGQGQCLIRAAGQIVATRLSQVLIECGRDIRVREGVYQSHLRAGGSIVIGETPETGLLLGGRLVALRQLRVGQIGNERKSVAHIHLGQDDYACDQFEAKNHALTELRQELDSTLKKLIQVRAQEVPLVNPELLQRKLHHLEQQVEQLRDELSFLEQTLFAWPCGQNLRLGKALWPELRFAMGPYQATFSAPLKGPITFCLEQEGTDTKIRARSEPVESAALDEPIPPEPHRAESPHTPPHSAIL
jgi:uncharacterized protein (DUF342 family)